MSVIKIFFSINFFPLLLLELLSKEPLLLNININCNNNTNNNTNTNKTEFRYKDSTESKKEESIFLQLYNNKKIIFVAVVFLYFSKYINFKKIINILYCIKNMIFKKKDDGKFKKLFTICRMCQKKNSFFYLNIWYFINNKAKM